MSEYTPDAQSLSRGYEITDVRPRPLFFSALLLSLAVALVCVFLTWFFGLLEFRAKRRDPVLSPLVVKREEDVSRGATRPQLLQTNPADDLARMRSGEDRALNGYRWIDKKNGVVQVPIDRAMDLLVDEGLPETTAEVPLVEPDEEREGKREEPR
ncbi:MAG: hypothetical protein ACREHD_22180 [Pirellulales bacterium]